MKHRIFILFLCLCLLLCGCSTEGSPAPSPSEDAFSFTDDLGRTVTIDRPQRVAALLGSFAQIWMLAGGDVVATPDDAWDDLHLPLSDSVQNLGGTKNLSLELLLASNPDFILASANTRQHIEWQETLTASGIPTAYFDVANFDDYLRLLKLCTDITGRSDLFELYGTAVQSQIEAVFARNAARLAETEPPTVLCMRSSASKLTVKNSENNVLGEMLASLGCINIADSDTSLLENLSIERIIEADPDYIFIVQQGDDEAGMRQLVEQTLDDPLWQSLSAVQNSRFYIMDKNLFNLKPNHRWAEAYEILEGILANAK